MRRWSSWILAAVLVAGCAPFTAVGGKLALADLGFEVDVPQGWYRHEFAREEVAVKEGASRAQGPGGKTLVITRDGLGLQTIRIEGVSVEQELPHTKRKFAPGMPPHDVAELELDNARSNRAAFNFELVENVPATVAGRSGFRLVYTWKTKEGLAVKRVHYGFQDGKWVYRLIYQAAARHYFDRDLPTFERVRESFRLLTRPA